MAAPRPVLALGVAGSLLGFAGFAPAQQTTRLSVDSSGAEANGPSGGATCSSDGQITAFESWATDLVPGDTNTCSDVFVRDRASGSTERVSVDSTGAEGLGDSHRPALSADGNVVAFFSWAANLVAGDTNGWADVFVRERSHGITELVSVDSSGGQANDGSYDPVLSADGQIVAFTSSATNLVASDTNARADVFVHNRTTGITERVSVDSAGTEADGSSSMPALSADGRYVAFRSDATNLVPGDTNALPDAFLHDRVTGATERVSVDSSGGQADGGNYAPGISADGNVVAWLSDATTLVQNDGNGCFDVFVHDRSLGITERASVDSAGNEGDGNCGDPFGGPPALSSDGRFVAFTSAATNLVAGDTNLAYDVFLHDRGSGVTEWLSVDSTGVEGNRDSFLGPQGAMAPDGRAVTFTSLATNLVAGDANGATDVFIRDREFAAWTNYGSGLPGTRGVPAIVPDRTPALGATVTVAVDNSLGLPTSGLLFLGFQRAQIPTHFGADLLVAPALVLPITFSYGSDTFSGAIPDDPALFGIAIDLQVVEADSGALKGVSFTPGLELLVGY